MAPPWGKGGASVRRGEERGDRPDDSNWLQLRLWALACLGVSRGTFGPISGALGQALFVIDPVQIRDVIQPLLVFRRQATARAKYLSDEVKGFAPRFSIVRQHPRDSREGGGLVDHEHVELFADGRLEVPKWHVAVCAAEPARHLESAFVDGLP